MSSDPGWGECAWQRLASGWPGSWGVRQVGLRAGGAGHGGAGPLHAAYKLELLLKPELTWGGVWLAMRLCLKRPPSASDSQGLLGSLSWAGAAADALPDCKAVGRAVWAERGSCMPWWCALVSELLSARCLLCGWLLGRMQHRAVFVNRRGGGFPSRWLLSASIRGGGMGTGFVT